METDPAIRYKSRFSNQFATEALRRRAAGRTQLAAALRLRPARRAAQRTTFTARRADSRRSWLSRIRPSAMHRPFEPMDAARFVSDFSAVLAPPNQLRWNPLPLTAVPTDFIDGIVTTAGNGEPQAQAGAAVHL